MKTLIASLLIIVSLASCEKEHCAYITDQNGETCCVECFRSERKMLNWSADNLSKGCSVCN